MDVEEWQKRLEDNFTECGMVGGHLLEVIEMEKAYGQHIVASFHGQSLLMDSFQSFFIETLRLAQAWVAGNGWPEGCPYYSPILVFYLTVFRNFRACQNLFVTGYPLDGFALFRNVKDRALLLCGIARNLTTFEAITAAEKKDRMREERRVFDLIIGKNSGLSAEARDEIARWERLFHQEVHGSKLSYFIELGEITRGERPLSVAPVPDDRSIAMYMNRVVEVGWMFTRLFPYLQPAEGAFGEDWLKKQAILDDSFRVSEQALARLKKKIADVLIDVVDAKFSFPEVFHYFEADGSDVEQHS